MKINLDIDGKYDDTEVIIRAPHLNNDIERMVAMMRMIDMQIAVRKDNETYLLETEKILYIEAVDRNQGQYKIRNYVTGKYVSSTTTEDGFAFMTDEQNPLVFKTVDDDRKSLYIYNGDGEMLANNPHIGTTLLTVMVPWKLQKIDAASLEGPATQLRLALAQKMNEVGNPYFETYENLSEEQLSTFKSLWDKADDALKNGIYDILFERLIAELDAASKGEYEAPVYDKYQKKALRVLSYNVRHCAENHGNLNLPRTASVISAQNADVVALQEVDSVFSSRSDYKYQIKELSEATGMYGIFCSALTGYGVGMLSKELPLSVKVVSLTADGEPRRMLMAEFNDYVFASLHVGLSANARRGSGPIIKAAAESWVETGKPLIIAGDFNDDGTDDEMQGARGVLTEYLQSNGFTYHSDMTTPTWSDGIYIIDHIISYDPIGGVEKVSYEVVNDKVTSDHMPIIGDLIVGFDNPDGIKSIQNSKFKIQNDVYDLSGRLIVNSDWSNVKLPNGIYIFNGKKMKK